MTKNTKFLTFYDPQNQVFDKIHTFGDIVMSQNMELYHFSEKKPLREQPQTKNNLKESYFENLACPKFWKCVIFEKKKRLRHARTDKNSF